MDDRIILHSDLNAFFASVEAVLHPELCGKPIAVCGDTEDRHGIVLAKSEPAKRMGVTTGMLNSAARAACPGLIIVPPSYGAYDRFSQLAHAIYERYTDLIEAFGIDECWLDVTGSTRLFGSGEEIANRIREDMKRELGLTVSVGVSFNKVYAKLGSDLKKPDAVTVISRENYREVVYPLPVSDLLFVGKSTAAKLHMWGIHTIGQLAEADPVLLRKLLGVAGPNLKLFASGLDASPVTPSGYEPEAKSVSHGVTCSRDLTNRDAVWRILLELTQEIGDKLREQKQAAAGVTLYVKYPDLSGEQFCTRLPEPTQSPMRIARVAQQLYDTHAQRMRPVRALTVGVSPLCPAGQAFQVDLFRDTARLEREDKVDETVDVLRRRFGSRILRPATLLMDAPLPKHGKSSKTNE